MTQQWLDYYSGSHHTVVLLFLANMPRQIAWCKWFTWNKGLSHCTCGVATITRANRNQQTRGSKTKTSDRNVPRDFTAELPDWRFPPQTRENNTNQARKNSSPTSPAGQETSQRATLLWYSYERWDPHRKNSTAKASRGMWIKQGESTLGKLHGRVGKGGKIFTVHKKEKFPRISNFIPLRYGPKQLAESRPGRWSNS